MALQQKQLIKCQEIVSMAHPNEQILLIPQGTVYHSILAGVHETQDYEVLVDVMDAHLERMNKTDQAHTLIITLLELYRKDDVLTVFSQYLKQLEEIVKTNPEQINCIFIPFNLGKSDYLAAIPAKYEDNQLNNIENNENSLRSTDLQSIDNIGKNDSAGITDLVIKLSGNPVTFF